MRKLILVFAFLLFGSTAAAVVNPDAWFFEIDGDHGSIISDVIEGPHESGPNPDYLPGTVEVDDGGYQTLGRREEASCSNWSHGAFEPYAGHDSYRVHCAQQTRPECLGGEPPADCRRRNEQMILNKWMAGLDNKRYFTFAFRLTTLPEIPSASEPDKRGYIAQWHHGV